MDLSAFRCTQSATNVSPGEEFLKDTGHITLMLLISRRCTKIGVQNVLLILLHPPGRDLKQGCRCETLQIEVARLHE